MEIFGFVIGVWTSILIGLFFIAMVIGVTFDRHSKESPKWWIFTVAIITWLCYNYTNLSWSALWSSYMWTLIGEYLAIGLAYSVLEFFLEVRRSVRYWKGNWEGYKTAWNKRAAGDKSDRSYLDSIGDDTTDTKGGPTAMVNAFLSRYGNDRYRIVGVTVNKDKTAVEPKINRQQLAETIGCWTFFWPFYFVSLIIGDLVTELFRIVADLLVSLSGRFVRTAFKDVFNFS